MGGGLLLGSWALGRKYFDLDGTLGSELGCLDLGCGRLASLGAWYSVSGSGGRYSRRGGEKFIICWLGASGSGPCCGSGGGRLGGRYSLDGGA